MRLIQWVPLQNLAAMSHRLNEDPHVQHTEDAYRTWAPPVDIFEKNDHVLLRAEIPGVQKEDMEVRVENGMLTLRGERKQDSEIQEENAHRVERRFGTFSRSFVISKTLDAARVTATYKDGILELSIPKVETAKSQPIEIKAA